MTQKLKMASNLLLKISVLFVLQAIILLMISNYHAQPGTPTDNINNSIPEAPKEKPKTTNTHSKAKPASKK